MALDYTLQMLEGLEAAHAIGVVHRDLKPDNVFVVTTPKGPLVKLLDFGIAKLRSSKEFQGGLTRPGVMMGTPEYMAPEQAYAADSVDVRADVYSVGAILYEMLAGTRPAQGEDPLEIAAFIMAQKVPRLSQVDRTIPERLSEVVHRAMAPMPADRFTTVSELRAALTPLSGSQPPAHGNAGPGPRCAGHASARRRRAGARDARRHGWARGSRARRPKQAPMDRAEHMPRRRISRRLPTRFRRPRRGPIPTCQVFPHPRGTRTCRRCRARPRSALDVCRFGFSLG